MYYLLINTLIYYLLFINKYSFYYLYIFIYLLCINKYYFYYLMFNYLLFIIQLFIIYYSIIYYMLISNGFLIYIYDIIKKKKKFNKKICKDIKYYTNNMNLFFSIVSYKYAMLMYNIYKFK